MKVAIVAFIVTALLSSPAVAQTTGRLDPAATRRAVAAATDAPKKTRMSPDDAMFTGVVVGACIGGALGWVLWPPGRDCAQCPRSRAESVFTMAVTGSAVGGVIGSVVGSRPARRPGIPLGRHVTAAPAVSPSRMGGALTVSF